MRQKAAAAREKEFPSQPGKPAATPRENDAVDRRPIVDSSPRHASSKEKGKQRAVDEDEGQDAGGSRRIPPVDAAKKRRSETDLDDMTRVAPKPSRPFGEEPQAPRQRPRIEATNGHHAPSTSKTSKVRPVSAAVEDIESDVESSEDDLMQEQFGSYVNGRRMFTQEEDEYLIKYIAKYNPQIAGRQGNRLYMTLVENPEKWSWGRAHSWQSWRERYRKNQVEFDQKIKRYMRQKAAAALEKEFPSQPGEPEAIPSKARRENDTVDRRPIVDSSTLHAPSKEKGKQRAVDEDEGQHAGGSRRIPPVEAAAKRPSEKDLDDMRRVAPKPSKPLGEEPQAPRRRPRIEDTNEHIAPSTSKTSNVQAPAEPIRAPVEDTESAVEPLEDDLMQELFGSYVEEDAEEEVEELVPDSQADEEELDTNVQSIYPKAEPHVPGAFEAATYEPPSPPSRPLTPAEPPQPPPAAPPSKKRKPKPRQPADEDPFGTPSEPPSPPPRPRHGLTLFLRVGRS
ncbi:hypothetical protein BJ912DRAFT_1147913 [Pholiota molesta]|nr:hypothetical protein BJ912DRAFT_1147913 [Pholiota molesta]